MADNHDQIFDVRGIKSIRDFNQKIIINRARQISSGNGSVYTRFYNEEKLSSLPLRSQPDEAKISRVIVEFQENQHYLSAISVKRRPLFPAHQAHGRAS